MTLQNGLIHNGTGYLWTDTSIFDPISLKPLGHLEKAFTGTSWPWAAVHSGLHDMSRPHQVPNLIAKADPKTPTQLLQACVTALLSETSAGRPGARLLVCHTCPDYGARLWFIAADETPIAKPYQPEEVLELTSSGRNPPPGIAAGDFDPASMRRYIDWQTAQPTTTVIAGQGYSIGGNILEVKVTPNGAEVEIIREMVGSHVR